MSTFCLPGSVLEVKEEFEKCRKRPRIHRITGLNGLFRRLASSTGT